MIEDFSLDNFNLKKVGLDLKKSSEEKKKEKPNLWSRAFRKSKLNKPSKIAVIYLRDNGTAETMEVDSMRGFFNINGRVYHEDRDCVYRMNKEKYPLAIIPEWNVIPIGRKEWEDKPMQEKFATLQDHVMKGIRHAERVRMGEGDYKKINIKSAIGIGIIAIVVIAIIMQYMG